MSSSKRRLSQGSPALMALVDDDDIEQENEIDPMALVHASGSSRHGRKSISPGSRRRSSFGGLQKSPTKSSAEQARIAEMYKNVIKLSSENVSFSKEYSGRKL